MKKQINSTIKAHLLRSAFFLVLLLLVIHVIPRALGQRDASKRSSDVEIPLLNQQPPPFEPGSESLSHLDGGTWTPTSSLNTARYLHAASLLPNGMVLVAGGSVGVGV